MVVMRSSGRANPDGLGKGLGQVGRLAAGGNDQRRRVAGICELQRPVRADDGVDEGGEPLVATEADQFVDTCHHSGRVVAFYCVGAQRDTDVPHQCGGRNAVAHNVADNQPTRWSGRAMTSNQSPPTLLDSPLGS